MCTFTRREFLYYRRLTPRKPPRPSLEWGAVIPVIAYLGTRTPVPCKSRGYRRHSRQMTAIKSNKYSLALQTHISLAELLYENVFGLGLCVLFAVCRCIPYYTTHNALCAVSGVPISRNMNTNENQLCVFEYLHYPSFPYVGALLVVSYRRLFHAFVVYCLFYPLYL